MQTFTDSHADDRNHLAPIGYGLGALCLLALFALLHHPVSHGHQPAEILASIRSQTVAGQLVHATLATIFAFLATAMVLFADRLGWRRFTVVFGLVAFLCAFVLTVLATLTDGFVIPALAQRCAADPSLACASESATLARLSAIQIEYLTRFSFVAIAAAVASWSVALLFTRNLARWPAVVGLASSLCQIGALLAASGRLVPASLLVIFAAQCVWYLLAASLMIRQPGPFAGAFPGTRP